MKKRKKLPYILDPKPIDSGGQAEVLRAVHRTTGAAVALKRRKDSGAAAVDRMRREIDVQSAIRHRNVMPILDFDAETHRWFTMPIAETTLAKQQTPIPTDELIAVLRDAASGLAAAHAAGFVHRDIKPTNILRLNDESGVRWVVADWGLVRRPVGQTTAEHTHTGVLLGTDGFAPPESYHDSHDIDGSWDVYSLGRLAAWATTGTNPRTLVDLVAPEPWRRFVRVLTDFNPRKRPADMGRVVELLDQLTAAHLSVPGVSEDTLRAAKAGDPQATVAVLEAALDYPDDEAFFIDDLAHLIGPGLDSFVEEDPDGAKRLLDLMDTHLGQIDWGRRDFDHYNVPLHWMQRVGQASIAAGALDLLEDAASALFRHEPRRDRYIQKRRTTEWIASLQGEAARRVAQILRENPTAARYYGELRQAVDAGIRGVLRAAAQDESASAG